MKFGTPSDIANTPEASKAHGALGHVTVTGDVNGEYGIVEKHDDGTLVVKPEPPIAAWYREIGATPVGEAELEAEAGPLGEYDDEG